jgi:two-component system, NtrC family, response regulator HydG
VMFETGSIHMLLVGAPGSEFRIAAAMARETGAEVAMADDAGMALGMLRDTGSDLVMIDVTQDVTRFIGQLRSEHIAIPVIACGIDASADRAVAAIRGGARDYVPLPPQADLIAAAILSVAQHDARLVGDDPELRRALALSLAMARSNAPIIIAGEQGSGREIFARTVHKASGRTGRFLTVDCANTSTETIESELFGHGVGDFPGAIAARRGGLEEARDGTVFLREVGSLSLATQARLLTVVQAQQARFSEGGVAPSHPRIIAGTSVDLDALVTSGSFLNSLLARLSLVHVAVPPLRARTGDIMAIADYFAGRFAAANGLAHLPFANDAIQSLTRHDWPGNVRELESVIHRAVLLARGDLITGSAIVAADGTALGAPKPPADSVSAAAFVGRTVDDVERDLILHTLEHCGGNRTSASTILGISVRTMRNKLRTFIEAGIPVQPAH